MRFVIVESPYAGDIEANEEYARKCLHDCLMRGEAPFASHLLYTQPCVLDDLKLDERNRGIEAGLEIAKRADATVVYLDHGISKGMESGMGAALKAHRVMEYRWFNGRAEAVMVFSSAVAAKAAKEMVV
jgi:hypothetical protein